VYVRHFRSTQEVAKIRRKTSSLLATRSCLVKVFRFQRKTLLLFYCFFFSIIIKVFRFNGRPYCYSSVSFSLLRSSVSNGRPYCYSSVSFSLLLFFFFLTRFLQNAWTDFHEIFRDGVYWSSLDKNNFSCDDVTSGLSY